MFADVAVLAAALLAAPAPPSPARARASLAHHEAGQQALRALNFERAAEEFNQAIRLQPLFTLAHYGLGEAYMQGRRYPDAVRAFTTCRESFHAVVALYQDEEIRDLQDSIRLFRSGRVNAANVSAALTGLEGRRARPDDRRGRAATGVDTPAELSLALGSAHFHAGTLAEAERAYAEAVRVNPGLGEAQNNLAVVYLMTGRLQEAAQAVERARKSGYAVHPQLAKAIEARRRSR